MKIKSILLLLTTCFLMISFSIGAYATEYVFDENGVVIAEIEDTTSGYIFDENGIVIGEGGTTAAHSFGGSSDIAIIGGADGPTAIFVAEPNPTFLFVALGVAAAAIIVIAVVAVKRKKKN